MIAKMFRILAATVCLSSAALAQGIIIPDDCHRCPRPLPPRPRPLPRVLKVKSIKITTRIDSQVATTRVEQVFENDTPYRLEGQYFFPLPESASVQDFAIYDGEKRLSGEVMERHRARQIYNEIVRRQIDPGLLEYVGKDLFQASVFPIEPRSTRKIELAYSQSLKNESGTVAYRYELGSGRRIIQQPIGQIAASVEINSPIDLKNIYSPTHKISVTRDGERRARLSFEGSGEEAQKDFQLYYSLSEKEFGLSLITHREPAKDGFFMMLISPKVNISEAERAAKDVVFVFDTSGSMSGEKIQQAKASLRFGVDSLSERDRFNIISFSGEEHLMKSNLTQATREAKNGARAFIERLNAEGGTNINDALVAAMRQFQNSGRPGMIVFVTDGKPTVGATDIKQIAKNVQEANRANVRLFSFGVGHDLNTNLLDKLASDNRGANDYVEPGEDLEVKVSNFFAKVNYPVLSDLRLDLGGVEADYMYPRNLPDLFKGSQLTIIGRYKNSVSNATVRLTGRVGGREQTFTFANQNFASERSDNNFLPRLWATRRVGFLMEQIRLNGESRELIDEIVTLGTRYGIVTPYTSYLVTEDVKVALRQAQGSGRRMNEESKRAINSAAMAPGAFEGEAGVARSRADKDMAQADRAISLDSYLTTIRAVDSKTFSLKDGVWVDTEFKESAALPRVELKFGSDEFFNLLAREPKLAEYFSLGQKVVVVYKGKVYRVM
ncbi:MAG: VIT domain-containing protein [Acidobacteriota bacterium]